MVKICFHVGHLKWCLRFNSFGLLLFDGLEGTLLLKLIYLVHIEDSNIVEELANIRRNIFSLDHIRSHKLTSKGCKNKRNFIV